MRRLDAIAELFNYLDETRDLIEEDEDLKEVICKDHVTLLLGKLTLMPAVLKGSMVSSISDQLHLSNKENFHYSTRTHVDDKLIRNIVNSHRFAALQFLHRSCNIIQSQIPVNPAIRVSLD